MVVSRRPSISFFSIHRSERIFSPKKERKEKRSKSWKRRNRENWTRVFKRADWSLIWRKKKLWENRGRREEVFTKIRGRFLEGFQWVTRVEDRANDEASWRTGARKGREEVSWMAGGINEDGVALGRRRFSLAPRRRLSSAREILPRTFRGCGRHEKREFDRLPYLSRCNAKFEVT